MGLELMSVTSLLILLSASALFSGSETAFFSLTPSRLKRMVEKGYETVPQIRHLLLSPRRLITTLLIGNELVNMGIAMISATLFQTWLPGRPFVVVVIASVSVTTAVLMLFGEITPKALALPRPELFASIAVRPISIIFSLLAPVSWLLWRIASIPISRLTRKKAKKREIREEDLRKLVSAGTEDGTIQETEKEWIHNIFEFGDTPISAIMTPRSKIFSLSYNLAINQIITEIKKRPISRVPIYRNHPDNIIGILFVRELLGMQQWPELIKSRPLLEMLKRPYFVPQTKKAGDLFREFQRKKIHLAVAVDEYGGVTGIVTMEDLLGKLFGEIREDYTESPDNIREITRGRYEIAADMPIADFNLHTGLTLSSEQHVSIGGLVSGALGRVPGANESVILDGIRYKVLKREGGRLISLLVDTSKSQAFKQKSGGKA